ncbi:TonB-dependent receptor [Parahaliea sp. F7430]|uniref:TonB-dependent receptor n=1 Tax=Sediminihaliea albiluteola TaxID=2758564 RepID=A0A7W2TUN4_9GAMM|nr:TonB-dependent receptor [Sediminihaliea albiluteola]MBA6412226.1 TonB-dependent receptor [Sediminihaliea albiluteola]
MNKSLGMGLRRAVLPLAVLTAIAGSAQAQIEEVVVTAQKRTENLQETPIAISALTSNDMEKRGILDYDDIVKSMPTLSQTPYPSSDLLILYMRGQGVSDPMQVTSDGSVGLYIDGLYISRPQGALFDLAGLERVEVLRGPQGTLYGRNTTGGAVNLITAKPTGEFGFKQTLSFGSRDYFRSLTTVDLPAVGDLAAKLTVMKRNQDGYVKNAGGADFGLNDQLGGRLALRWDAAENFTVDYSMETGTLESSPMYYQSSIDTGLYPGYITGKKPTGKTYRPFDLKRSDSEFEGHGLTLTWDATEALTIKSLTGYRELDYDGYQNYAESFTIPAYSFDRVGNRQYSQELQFIGDVGNNLEYIVGLYYFKETSDHYQNYVTDLTPVGGMIVDKDRDVTSIAKSQAIYSQVTWTPPVLDNRLELTLGGRYTEDEREATRDFLVNGFALESNASNDQSFEQFDPSFTANFLWNDELSTYAKVSTGYKAGGSSEGSAPGTFEQTFDPEEVTTYELGLKSEWWDRRVRVNAALFYSEFTDMQLAFVSDAYDQSLIQSYNAGEATVQGAELSVTVMPTPDLMLQFDYAHLDPKFDEVIATSGSIFDPAMNPLSPYQVGEDIKQLFVLPYAPKRSLNLTADYTFWRTASMEANATVNYSFQSEVYDSAPAGRAVAGREFYSRPSYGLFDARLGFVFDLPRGDTATVALWGRNIFDKEYRQHVIGSGGAPVATPLGPAGFTFSAVSWAEPATYGIDLIYEY